MPQKGTLDGLVWSARIRPLTSNSTFESYPDTRIEIELELAMRLQKIFMVFY